MGRRFTAVAAAVIFVVCPEAWGYSLFGTSWGEGATVTYSFDYAGGYSVTEAGYGTVTTTAMGSAFDAGWEGDIVAALQTWAAICDIAFAEVADNGANFNAWGAEGDIRIAAHTFDGVYGVLAHGYYPPPNGATAAGDLHFDEDEPWHTGLGAPSGGEIDLYSVALHELGHSIGLGHSADTNAVMYPFYWYNAPRALGSDDIAGAQDLYGGNDSGSPTPEPSAAVLALACLASLGAMRLRLFRGGRHE